MYNFSNGYNIIYDSNGKNQIKWYDERYSYSRTSDEVGDINTKYYLEDNGETVDRSIREKFAATSYEYYSDEERNSRGYLAKNLVKSVTNPDGNVTRYTYYPDGNVKTETNPETGLPTMYEYNSYGLVTSKTTAGGHRTEYTYDKNGNFIKEELINPDDSSKNSITRSIYDNTEGKIHSYIKIFP